MLPTGCLVPGASYLAFECFDRGSGKPDQTAIRLEKYLAEAGKAYPGAWSAVEMLREDRGKGLPTWPDWCYLPMAGIIAIVSKGAPIGVVRAQIQELATRKIGPAALMALASWQ
jgi:hypothetical protein